MAKEYDYCFKLVIIGDSNVGKTSLILRFVDNFFNGSLIDTIGLDSKTKTILVNGERVKLLIWDTAGQEQFRNIIPAYYRNADGAIVVYDVTEAYSFVNAKYWFEEINLNCNSVALILVGNKDDDPKKKVVQTEEANNFANLFFIKLFETSAKNNTNVEEMFNAITELVLRKKYEHNINESHSNDIVQFDYSPKNENTKRKCC